MYRWLLNLWNNEAAFKRAIRGVAVAAALGASTSAGAEVLRGMGVVSSEARSLLVMILGGAGAAIGVGDKNRPPVGDPPLELDP
jgi:hypothetical protein